MMEHFQHQNTFLAICIFFSFSLSLCQWRDSNPQSSDYESTALPLCNRSTTIAEAFSKLACFAPIKECFEPDKGSLLMDNLSSVLVATTLSWCVCGAVPNRDGEVIDIDANIDRLSYNIDYR
jgi:hypothetical protein